MRNRIKPYCKLLVRLFGTIPFLSVIPLTDSMLKQIHDYIGEILTECDDPRSAVPLSLIFLERLPEAFVHQIHSTIVRKVNDIITSDAVVEGVGATEVKVKEAMVYTSAVY